MPALGAGIHVFVKAKKDVDGRDKPGHDEIYFFSVAAPAAAGSSFFSLPGCPAST
jgi:hypothetical protein